MQFARICFEAVCKNGENYWDSLCFAGNNSFIVQISCHFALNGHGCFTRCVDKILRFVCIYDRTGRVYQQSALVVHAVLGHFGEASALCAYARNQQEVVGCVFADIQEHLSLGSAYYVHHLFVRSPVLRLFQYFFEQPFAVCIFCQLEVVGTFIRSQCQ